MTSKLQQRHRDMLREKIQAGMLIERLESHVLRDKKMEKSQVSAAIALLRKILPDLQTVDGNQQITIAKHEEQLDKLE